MQETNIENNMISEEDLEKAAGGLKMNKNTLKKALLAAGAIGLAGAGGYYICKLNKERNKNKNISFSGIDGWADENEPYHMI